MVSKKQQKPTHPQKYSQVHPKRSVANFQLISPSLSMSDVFLEAPGPEKRSMGS